MTRFPHAPVDWRFKRTNGDASVAVTVFWDTPPQADPPGQADFTPATISATWWLASAGRVHETAVAQVRHLFAGEPAFAERLRHHLDAAQDAAFVMATQTDLPF